MSVRWTVRAGERAQLEEVQLKRSLELRALAHLLLRGTARGGRDRRAGAVGGTPARYEGLLPFIER